MRVTVSLCLGSRRKLVMKLGRRRELKRERLPTSGRWKLERGFRELAKPIPPGGTERIWI